MRAYGQAVVQYSTDPLSDSRRPPTRP